MNEIIHAGTHVRVLDDEGDLIGCGVYMGLGPVNFDVPNFDLVAGSAIPLIEMDSGYPLYGNFDLEPIATPTIH